MAQGKLGLPKVIFHGTGVVKKSPIGKFIWEILNVVDPTQRIFSSVERQNAKNAIMQVLFRRLGVERNRDQPVDKDYQKLIVHDLMDQFNIIDDNTVGVQIKEQFKSILRKFLIGVENGSLKND